MDGGSTRRDQIRNEYIRGTVKVTEISKKIQESRLRWYGHLRRRVGEDHVGREVMEMEVHGNRRRGRPKRRWIDNVNRDLREKSLSPEMANNRNAWRRLIHNGYPEQGKAGKKKKKKFHLLCQREISSSSRRPDIFSYQSCLIWVVVVLWKFTNLRKS